MNFQAHLAAKVLDGTKTVTRRAISTNPRSPWHPDRAQRLVDTTPAVCPGRGRHAIGRILVTSVTEVRLGDIDQAEARAEGFESVETFEAAWMQINGGWNPDQRLWRIAFQVATTEPQED